MTRNVRDHLFATAIAVAAVGLAAPAQAADYTIDPAHTFVSFNITHLGMSTLRGRFNTVSGKLVWDEGNPSASSIVIDIDPASVDSNHAERDKHVRSEDFLDVQTHKSAGFKSTGYQGNASGGKLMGELTLHGVTKPVTIEVRRLGEGPDPWGGYRVGFVGSTMIKRADFGMDYNLGPAAETMAFELTVEGIRQ